METSTLSTHHTYLSKDENELLERAASGAIEQRQANELVAHLLLRLALQREDAHRACTY